MKRNQGFLEKWLLPNQEQEIHKISLLDNKKLSNTIGIMQNKTTQNKEHIATLKGLALAKNG